MSTTQQIFNFLPCIRADAKPKRQLPEPGNEKNDIQYVMGHTLKDGRTYNGQVKIVRNGDSGKPPRYVLHGLGEMQFKTGLLLVGRWRDGKWVGIASHMRRLTELSLADREKVLEGKDNFHRLAKHSNRSSTAFSEMSCQTQPCLTIKDSALEDDVHFRSKTE